MTDARRPGRTTPPAYTICSNRGIFLTDSGACLPLGNSHYPQKHWRLCGYGVPASDNTHYVHQRIVLTGHLARVCVAMRGEHRPGARSRVSMPARVSSGPYSRGDSRRFPAVSTPPEPPGARGEAPPSV